MKVMTTEDLAEMMLAIRRDLGCLKKRLGDVLTLNEILIGRLTDHTHLTIDEVAAAWGVSPTTVRRKVNERGLTVEVIPGSRRRGIPISEVRRWMPVGAARAAEESDR